MIVGPGYMELVHEIAALPPGAAVGLVCASETGTDNIAETLRLAGATGVEIVRAVIGSDEGLQHIDDVADLILLSREAIALGLDDRFSRPERVGPGSTSSTPRASSCSGGRSNMSRTSGRRRTGWKSDQPSSRPRSAPSAEVAPRQPTEREFRLARLARDATAWPT